MKDLDLESDYFYAQQHPEARQEFINSIDLEKCKQYIGKVNYCPNYDFVYHSHCLKKTGTLMRIGISPFYRLWKGQRSAVIVYPEAFSSQAIQNNGDFLSCLIDHEGTHARDLFEDPFSMLAGMTEIEARVAEGSWNRAFEKRTAAEQRAIYCQIQNFQRRYCSPQFRKLILEKHKENEESLSRR